MIEELRIDGSSWRGRLLFTFVFSLIIYWSSFLFTFIHEVLGHGLVAILEGQNFYGFIATITEGLAFVTTGGEPWMDAMIAAGGIIVQFLFGVVVFLISFRLKGFTLRTVALLFAIMCMLTSGSYLFVGSMMKHGDPVGISYFLNVPSEALAFLGLTLIVFVCFITFPEFTKVLQNFFMFKSRRDAYVSLVLMFTMGTFPYFLLSAMLGASMYPLMSFFLVVVLVLVFFAYAVKKHKLPDTSLLQQRFMSWRGVGANLLLAIAVTAVWLGVFGPTVETAHGLLWEEFGPVGIANVKLTVYKDFTAKVEVRFRPAFSVLISENLWFSVKDSPNWDIYIEETERFITTMFNTMSLEVLATETDNADIWYLGKWHSGGARGVVTNLNLNHSANLKALNGEFVLRIIDPWAPLGFLDSFNITCDGLKITSYQYAPSIASDNTAGGIDEEYLLWLSETAEEAPDMFDITLIKD